MTQEDKKGQKAITLTHLRYLNGINYKNWIFSNELFHEKTTKMAQFSSIANLSKKFNFLKIVIGKKILTQIFDFIKIVNKKIIFSIKIS